MSKRKETEKHWYETVQSYTEQLVSIRSVSPGTGEILVVERVLALLCAGGIRHTYTEHGLDALEHDPYGRQNAYAFLRGKSSETIVLLGHIDTVDTKDYGPLEKWALSPDELAHRRDRLIQRKDETEDTADWMFGRGTADMKSGVAVNIALMRRMAELAQREQLPLSIVFLATPDEENESAGVLQAVQYLLRLREQYGLHYIGAINTDFTTALYPGDPHHYAFLGTVGKLLPSFLCIGRESHVGTPFNGLDANLLAAELISDLSMNDELCDRLPGQITAPPVTLHAADLKTRYDVQIPFITYFYLNVLTFTTGPDALLERLRQRTITVINHLLQRIDAAEERWSTASGVRQGVTQRQARVGTVLSYAELYRETVQHVGKERVDADLKTEWERWSSNIDTRERSLHLVHRLWTISGKQGPAVILYYSPPYYPHVAPIAGALKDAAATIVSAHPEVQLALREYFPYLSDLSYLRLEGEMNLEALTANMPLWRDPAAPARPGSYSLPLEAIQQLGIPVINFGVHGRGAHQRDEGVIKSYSFGTLPQLLYEMIEQLALIVKEQ